MAEISKVQWVRLLDTDLEYIKNTDMTVSSFVRTAVHHWILSGCEHNKLIKLRESGENRLRGE